MMNYFLYVLIRPRPAFPADITGPEAAIMGKHVEYWRGLLEQGRTVAFGPVSDLADAGGIAIVEAETEDDVRRLGEADPAVTTGLTTFRVSPMPGALVRS